MDSLLFPISKELLSTSASSFYSGHYECPIFKQGNGTYYFNEPLDYNITITNTSGALLVIGQIKGIAKTNCARCLEEAIVTVNGEVEGYFLLPNSDKELTEEERDEYIVLEDYKGLDVAPLFSAAISLALPLVPLCQINCKGLCDQCGTNLNVKTCDCSKKKDDISSPFSVLKSLNFEK